MNKQQQPTNQQQPNKAEQATKAEQPTKAETAHQITTLSQAIPKNVNTASVTNRGQQENIDLIIVINFVEQTMATLS